MKKETKSNSRSFRYSDRVAQILEESEGENLNSKFENLVLFCYDSLPAVKKNYEMYKGFADDECNRWRSLHEDLKLVDSMIDELRSVKNRILSISERVSNLEEEM